MANQTIPNRQDWKFVLGGKGKNILKDKERLILSTILKMLSKTQRIFEYKNLPEELPAREIELIKTNIYDLRIMFDERGHTERSSIISCFVFFLSV